MRATASHDLIFEHVQVPLEACLETVQRGKAAGWLLHIPACYLGIAEQTTASIEVASRSVNQQNLSTENVAENTSKLKLAIEQLNQQIFWSEA